MQLNALWTLYATGNCSEKDLIRFARRFSNEFVKSWCIRLITDNTDVPPSAAAIEQLQSMASSDSGLVRHYLASSISKLPSSSAFDLAIKLSSENVDSNDRAQPKLIWHQIEPFIVDDFERSMELFSASKSRMLRRNIVRRLACDPEKQDEMLEKLVRVLPGEEQMFTEDVLAGIRQAIEGRRKMTAPKSWNSLVKKAGSFDVKCSKLVEEISTVFGDGLSLDRLKKIAVDKKADPTARSEAILALGQYGDPKELFALFKGSINDRLVSPAIVKTLAVCRNPEVADAILNQYRWLPEDAKENAMDTLCIRKPWADKLLSAMGNGRLTSERLTAWHARQIQLFNDDALTEKLAKVWGKVRETGADRLVQINQLRGMLTEDQIASANVSDGKKLFSRHCASCHAMFGEGGNIGPDLTGSDRKNLNYLLENIVDPSATVATSYRTSVLAMEDGRLLSGVVMDNDGQTLKLQTQEELLTLEVDLIEEIKQTELSLMPEKLLDKLSEQEKANLFGYLMSN